MTGRNDRSPKHLKWLIESRARNQHSSLSLYETMKNYPQSGQTVEGRALVAISFSLWRAAFLSDRTGQLEQKSKHAEYFLFKILADNAIGYTQDRDSREWTFNYYIDNARYRLAELSKTWPVISERDLQPPKGKRKSTNRWDCLQDAFDIAVGLFGKRYSVGEISN